MHRRGVIERQKGRKGNVLEENIKTEKEKDNKTKRSRLSVLISMSIELELYLFVGFVSLATQDVTKR
jgi:hypothetical protein